MSVISDLTDALTELLAQTVEQDLSHGIKLTEGERLARKKALLALAKAADMPHGDLGAGLVEEFPGLENGEDEVDGGDVVEWLTGYLYKGE